MDRASIPKEQYEKIMECFLDSMMRHGFKGTTMDGIASSLQMSKRTLYELFGNKEDLFVEAHKYFHNKNRKQLAKIFSSASNVMEAIIKCCLHNRDIMSNMSTNFIHDLAEYSTRVNVRPDETGNTLHKNLYEVLQKGVEEGFFREDINLRVQCHMFILQMGALKHIEKIFPEEITLLEAYDSISYGFLRGISTDKGLKEIEKYLPLPHQPEDASIKP